MENNVNLIVCGCYLIISYGEVRLLVQLLLIYLFKGSILLLIMCDYEMREKYE